MNIDDIKNKIINADCMEVLKQLPDNCIDLVITDPPYKKVQGGCTNHAVKLVGSTKEDLSKGTFFKENIIRFDEWLPECYRVLKECTHCYVMSDDRNLREILNVAEDCGFKLLNILTWKKTKHTPNRYYLKNSEFICMFRKGNARNINNMGTYQVLEFPNVENKIHPAEKPISLITCLIENSSDKGNLILEPFSGSGVVADCCKATQRDFICIEKDYAYWKASVERLNSICVF